jgi:hypothetical protein
MASDISAENGKTLGSEQDRKRRRLNLIFGRVVGRRRNWGRGVVRG